MIEWYSGLYLDKVTKKHEKKIKKIMEKGNKSALFYCIILATNPCDLFDIIRINEFRLDYYRKQDIFVVGLAFTKESAILMTVDLVNDLYTNTGAFDAKTYYRGSLD